VSADVVGALDIGGTHVTAGRVHLGSASIDRASRVRLPLPERGSTAELLTTIVGAARSIAGDGLDRLGVAVPGPFDYLAGVSLISHKLDGLRGVDLRGELAAALGLDDPLRIRFLNDAESFLLGECWVGAARGHARVVGITLGTGLGAAFVADGRIQRSGPNVPPGGSLYQLSFRGAPVEETISRRGVLALYGEREDGDVEQIAERAREGDAAAGRAFECLGRALGEFLAPWLARFEPSCLVVGGSIARSFALLEPGLRDALPPEWPGTLTVAKHLDDAPLLGAARHALETPRPVHELSVAEARLQDSEQFAGTAREPVGDVFEHAVTGPAGDITVRFYLPEGGPRPVLVYFFGGGWVLGSLDAVDGVCRHLAHATPCAVASVDYRLAPEHPFPAGLEDCYMATCWVAEHGDEVGLDTSRVAVGGASAGANLAAAVALLACEGDGPELAFQLLVYPLVDRRAAPSSPGGAAFGPRDLEWCWSHYLSDPADGENPLASPLRARDLAGLPRALVITAELDPVRDQAELYATRLETAGVSTELVRFEGVEHGFFSRTDLEAGAEARELAASRLRRAFDGAE
jgi:acetyl esterase